MRPSVETLLVLARTLGLSPDQLRRAGREDAAIALDLLGEEFDLSRVPIAALVNELTKAHGRTKNRLLDLGAQIHSDGTVIGTGRDRRRSAVGVPNSQRR